MCVRREPFSLSVCLVRSSTATYIHTTYLHTYTHTYIGLLIYYSIIYLLIAIHSSSVVILRPTRKQQATRKPRLTSTLTVFSAACAIRASYHSVPARLRPPPSSRSLPAQPPHSLTHHQQHRRRVQPKSVTTSTNSPHHKSCRMKKVLLKGAHTHIDR